MGKTAVEVVAQYKTIVNPKVGAPYVRKSMNTVRDPRLKAINSCMRSHLSGKRFNNRAEAQSAFASARASCKVGGGAPRADVMGRRMGRRY